MQYLEFELPCAVGSRCVLKRRLANPGEDRRISVLQPFIYPPADVPVRQWYLTARTAD
jgi:hypothetical protein